MSETSDPSLDARTFVLAILVDITADRNFDNRFKAAHRELHRFFWELKQHEQYKPFVEDLLFDTNGNYPHCHRIDELLQEFQLSGVLSRPNPTYKYNDIAIRGTASADEFKETLSADRRTHYQMILDDFKRQLGVPATQ